MWFQCKRVALHFVKLPGGKSLVVKTQATSKVLITRWEELGNCILLTCIVICVALHCVHCVGSLHCKHMHCVSCSPCCLARLCRLAPLVPLIALVQHPGAAGLRKARLDCVDLQLALVLVPLIAAPLHCLNSPHHHCSLTQHQSWTFSITSPPLIT